MQQIDERRPGVVTGREERQDRRLAHGRARLHVGFTVFGGTTANAPRCGAVCATRALPGSRPGCCPARVMRRGGFRGPRVLDVWVERGIRPRLTAVTPRRGRRGHSPPFWTYDRTNSSALAFEHAVDLVQQVVELFLQRLALAWLVPRPRPRLSSTLLGSGLLLLLSFWHICASCAYDSELVHQLVPVSCTGANNPERARGFP